MMKNLRVFSTILLVILIRIGFSQTTIINPATEGGFELGPTFADNGWIATSGTNNPWVVGTAVSNSPITGNSAYISNTGGATNAYDFVTPCTNYFYRDVTVPAGEAKIVLTFNWICQGESTFDLWQVFVAPTSITPTGVNTHPGSGASNVPSGIAGATFIGNGNLQSASVQTAVLSIPPSYAGTTFRLIFVWKSDTSGGTQPPAAIDNISLVSSLPSHIFSTASGDWTTAASWVGGVIPSQADTVTINTDHSININASNLGAAKLNVNGTLGYGTAPTSFTILSDLNINPGGTVNAFNSTTGKTLVVGGNITNEGTLNISVGTSSAGNLTLNGTSVQTVSGSGTFTSNLIRNLTLNNTNSSTPNIVWNVNNITIAFNISFTSGRLNLNGNKLSWYNSTNTSTGTMTVNAGQGILPGGKFARFWTTTQTGTSITAGVDPTTNTSRYPFINGSGQNRSMFITRSSSSSTGNTAGVLTVEYTDASTMTTGLSVADGTYTITDRYNGNWSITSEGGYVYASGTHTLTAIATQAYFASTTNSRLMNAASVVGNFQTGTLTPGAQRTGLTTAQITTAPFYLGINAAEIPTITVASGDWNNPAIWNKGVVPGCSDGAVINSGHTVNATAADSCKNITVLGTYIIDAGDNVKVGCSDNNAALNIDGGTFEMNTGGNLRINGKFALTANVNGIFKHNGGSIVVDGNSGTLATSTPSHVVDFYCHNTNTLQLNGGTLTIIDPPLSATTTICAFKVFPVSTSGFVSGSGTEWILKFGNGISTTAGGHANGYLMNLANTNSFSINGEVIVDVLAGGTNRHVQTSGNVPINNLTINSGEFRIASVTYIKGNIVNSGTLTTTSTLHCSDFAAAAAITATKSQSISGSGTFRNSTTSTTAAVSSLNINNSAGVTLNTPISVSSTLTLTNGIINTTATNFLRLGSTTSNGILSGTPDDTKHINGPFARTFASSTTATNTFTSTHLFPVGANGFYQPCWLSPTTTSGGPTIFTAQTFGVPNPGSAAPGVTNLSDATWIVSPNVTTNITNVHLQLGDYAISTGKQILQSATASGAYGGTSAGTTAGTSTLPPSIKTASPLPISEFTGFFAHGDLVPCVSPIDQPTSFNTPILGSTFLTGSFTAASSNPTGYLVVRYASPGTYTNPVDNTVYSTGATLGTGTVAYFGPATTFTQTGLTAGITYDFVIYAFNNTACFGPAYNISSPLIGMATTCSTATAAPGTPTASMITTNSFDATWTASTTPGVDYYIDVATNSGFTNLLPAYNNLNVGPVLTTTIAGLSANTNYFVRVKAVFAGCYSSNSSTLTVKTDCDPVSSFPNTETFATYITGTCWNEGTGGGPAAGPTIYSQTASASWSEDGYLNVGTTGSPRINIFTTGKNDWIISNSYSIPASNYRATFNVGATQYNTSNPLTSPWEEDDFVEVLISDGSYSNWNLVKIYNSTNVPSHLGQVDAIDLSAYSGQIVRFAFRAVEGAINGSADIDFFIDNFTVEETPTPTIISLGSMSGCPGSQMIINGTNLLGATAQNVKISGVSVAGIVSNTGTVLTVSLPAGPLTGTVSVTIGVNTTTSTESFTVLQRPTAVLSPAGTISICSDTSQLYTVTTDIGNTFLWKFNGVAINGANGNSYLATLAGNYKSIVSVSSTGCSDSTSISTLLVNPIPSSPTAGANSTDLCEGSNLNLISSAVIPITYAINSSGTESFIDIDATGVSVGTLSDDSEHNFNMPSFTFGGVEYTSGRVGMNGAIALGSSSGEIGFTNVALPTTTNTAGNILLLPWWDDLDIQATPATSIKTETVGSKFIIQFTDAVHNLAITSSIKFQVQLDNSNGKIHFVYNDVDLGSASYNGGISATVGIQTNSTTAYQYSFNTASLTNGQCITFTPASTLYTWIGPNGFSSSNQNPSIAGISSAGTGNYSVTFTNSLTGCINSASVSVTVNGDEVLNENNAGTGSLRKAIECATAADTVFVSLGTVQEINLLTQLNITKDVLILDDNGSPVVLKFDFSGTGLMNETNGAFRVGTSNNVKLDNIHIKHVGNDDMHPLIKNDGILTLKSTKVSGIAGNTTPPVIKNATGAAINIEGASEIKNE